MHALHLIAVEAADAESAISAAELALEPYGDGGVWDWYVTGGRWNDYFGDPEAPDEVTPTNAFCYSTDPERFNKELQHALDSRNRVFREYAGYLTGARVEPGDLPDFSMGIRLVDKTLVAQRTNERRERTKAEFEALLESDVIPDTADPGMSSLIPYYITKVGELTSGTYIFDSYFFDGTELTTKTCYLKSRCERSPDTQWLVAVDIHN